MPNLNFDQILSVWNVVLAVLAIALTIIVSWDKLNRSLLFVLAFWGILITTVAYFYKTYIGVVFPLPLVISDDWIENAARGAIGFSTVGAVIGYIDGRYCVYVREYHESTIVEKTVGMSTISVICGLIWAILLTYFKDILGPTYIRVLLGASGLGIVGIISMFYCDKYSMGCFSPIILAIMGLIWGGDCDSSGRCSNWVDNWIFAWEIF